MVGIQCSLYQRIASIYGRVIVQEQAGSLTSTTDCNMHESDMQDVQDMVDDDVDFDDAENPPQKKRRLSTAEHKDPIDDATLKKKIGMQLIHWMTVYMYMCKCTFSKILCTCTNFQCVFNLMQEFSI